MGQAAIFKQELKRRICRTLGLDPKQVRNLHLHLTPDDAITAEVERFVYDNELEKLEMEMRSFVLVPTSEPTIKDD